jgi:Asp/Glu/hydantoin racemase
MKLLLINPNTSAAITDLVVAAARRVAAPGTEIAGATGPFGARYIASRAAAAIAAHAALDAYAEHGGDADAVVLACFGDPGLAGLKELARQPVVGLAEASCHAAAMLGARFAIVTGGRAWGPMLREFVASIGLAGRLASVRTVAPTGAEIARDPEGSLALLADACARAAREDGADAVILGGAGLAGLAPSIADRVPVPLVDCVAAAVKAAEALAALAPAKAGEGAYAPAGPAETVGLTPHLAARLEAR